MGRTTQELELKQTRSGVSVLTSSIAVDRGFAVEIHRHVTFLGVEFGGHNGVNGIFGSPLLECFKHTKKY